MEGMATHFSILAWRIPVDRGAWRATVHGVAKSWIRLTHRLHPSLHTPHLPLGSPLCATPLHHSPAVGRPLPPRPPDLRKASLTGPSPFPHFRRGDERGPGQRQKRPIPSQPRLFDEGGAQVSVQPEMGSTGVKIRTQPGQGSGLSQRQATGFNQRQVSQPQHYCHFFCRMLYHVWASLVVQMIKNPPANAGDLGSIPGSGRSPGGGNGNPLQYCCLENPMERGAGRAASLPLTTRGQQHSTPSSQPKMSRHAPNPQGEQHCLPTPTRPLIENQGFRSGVALRLGPGHVQSGVRAQPRTKEA